MNVQCKRDVDLLLTFSLTYCFHIGCKNFTKLHDFRDKPEATKCIKCRQRGRQNYFAKKGRVDVLPNPHPRTTSTTKHNLMAASVANAHMTDPAHNGRYATPYEMYGDVDEAMAPRLTSSRQKDMQKNRMNRYQDRAMTMGANATKYMKNAAAAANISQTSYQDSMMIGYGPRRDRSNSVNSLLQGYNELPLDFQMYDGQEYDGLNNNDDDEAGGGRSRSNTLLSVGSIYDDKRGGGAQRRMSGTRNRTTSEEWGNLAQATASGQFNLVSQDMFKPEEGTAHPQFVQSGAGPSAANASGIPPMPQAAGGDGGRKRRVSIDLTNYFSAGWTGDGDNEGGGNNEAFETKRARNNSISEILSSII